MFNAQPLSYIRERDVDLLLLEEFHCSEPFQHWFLAQTIGSVSDSIRLFSAAHSVVSSNGESDLVVEFFSPNQERWCFLIENKVDADFQPEQAERYAARRDDYVNAGHCHHCRTVIVAPSQYLQTHPQEQKQFDHQLSYEAVREWFVQNPLSEQRNLYKANLISIAITQGVYRPNFSEIATENWQFLHQLMTQLAPEIRLPRLSRKHTNGGWKTLTAKDMFPGKLYIMYKSDRGFVDLTFPEQGPQASASQFQQFKEYFGSLLEPGMSIEAAYRSAVIRIKAAPTRITEPFESQVAAVQEAVEAARRLNQWVQNHYDDCQSWATA